MDLKKSISDFIFGADNLGEAVFEAIHGSNLVKAKLLAFKSPKDRTEIKDKSVEFFLNPHTIKITKEGKMEVVQPTGNQSKVTWTGTYPIKMDLGEVWFDTYEERTSVRKKYIEPLEKLLEYDVDTHYPPAVALLWGEFTGVAEKIGEYIFYVTSLGAEYTMFLPDGTPVRAKATLGLTQCMTAEEEREARPKASPDHAKLYTVRRGDTLQGIATYEYDDPREWRRIAESNKITDPMNLRPGMKLLVPPILS